MESIEEKEIEEKEIEEKEIEEKEIEEKKSKGKKPKERKIPNHAPDEMVEFYEYSKNNKGDVVFVKTKKKRWYFEHLLKEKKARML